MSSDSRGASAVCKMVPLVPTILVFVFGCTVLGPVDPSSPVALGAREGFVIVHIDTNVKLERIGSRTTVIAENVPIGESVRMVRAREGSYSWGTIDFVDERGYRGKYDLGGDPEFRFTVEPQKVNYPGQIRIHVDSLRWSAYAERRDRSAQAYLGLRDSHASILGAYVLRYDGETRHGFLEYLSPFLSPSPTTSGVESEEGSR